ncbi:MAG: protein translocase subunit SecD [Hyphomicrobiaceae bacterium]|nr:protein translocase subunit SecD [Hyphomicrobiaceae bacterium]
MQNSSPFRTVLIFLIALAGILFTLPNFLDRDGLKAWPDWLPKQQLVLGLDLQGGSHLLMQVDKQSVIDERLKELRRDIRQILANDKGIAHFIDTNGQTLTIRLSDPTQAQTAFDALQSLKANVTNSIFSVGGVAETDLTLNPDNTITFALTDAGIEARMSNLVSQSIEVIRKRIDELGTTEPTIQRQGSDRVLVQVPGFNDSQRLKDLISKTARLTFHLVVPNMSAAQARAQGLPAGTIILPSTTGGEELIYEDVSLGGESLVDAQPGFDSRTSQPIVTFRFDTRGAITFGEITSANVGQRFAIVLDGQVITAPVIQSPITGGSGQIEGSFTPQSANDLAVLLRAGALPATLDIIEERSVGPSLGADSVRAGVLAGIVGAALVVVYMLVAYGLFGIFANIALVINVLLIIGTLSILGSTLTLPGIAGIVLTIGMAVDANVLIFERMREEFAAGRSPFQAIHSGFSRAMGTILDANITTLIAAVVLFYLGSGPVQGFAVTLAIGIVTTLFTAYLVTQTIVNAWFALRRPKQLKIQFIRLIPDETRIPFMKWRMAAFSFTAIMILGSIGLLVFQGLNLGIDFKGGSAIEVQSKDGPADIGALRSTLGELGLGDVQIQGFGTPEDVLIRVETQPGPDTAQQEAVDKVTQAISANYEVRRTEVVGPTVSGELVTSGVIGILVAMVGILFYVWFRFEWQYAVGAIIATTHDVIATIGLFALMGFEFNLTSIAAILTIVGYSLNDTVVVYDRVRENLRKYRTMPIPDLIDLSVNSMLTRTLNTSATTLLALLALVFFGGEVIHGFTISMSWGILVGTYSSVFVAAPILIYFGLKTRQDAGKEEKPEKQPRRSDGAAV